MDTPPSSSGHAQHHEDGRQAEAHQQPCAFRAQGWPARILQHEVDHLDGVLYIDRMLTRSFSTIEHVKGLYGGKSIEEVRRMLGV